MSISNNRAGHVESHGVDFVPLSERRGSPRALFPVWAGANIAYLYFVVGGLLVYLGLDILQAVSIAVVANLAWAAVGYLATSGPASGSPSQVIARAFFGVNGNRVVQFVGNWVVGVLYEAINLSVGALAGVALVLQFAPDAPVWLQVLIILTLALVTFGISLYGHATIVRLGPWFSWVLLAALVVLSVFVVSRADLNYVPTGGVLEGGALWAVAATAFAICIAGPLSWTMSADYARYLPPTTSKRKTAFWTALGGFLPSTAITILGILAATVIDMSEPVGAMEALLPAWFYIIFLVVIMVGSIANNSLTAYSTGLALLAVGVPWKRSITIVFDAAIAITVTIWAVFASEFLPVVGGLLQLTITILSPLVTIYVLDIYLRRNLYDGPGLQVLSSRGPYWFTGGVNWGGLAALVVGGIAALMFVNTTFFVGPIAAQLNGADLSVFVGAIVGGGIYALTQRGQIRDSIADGSNSAQKVTR